MIEWLGIFMNSEEELCKTALITGASNGIGFEFAKILARNKYDLILVDRNKSKLDEIKNNFNQDYGVKVYVIACDLYQSDACRDIYEQVRRNNLDIDILINNAGMGDWGLFVDSNIEKQGQMLQLNIVALTNLTRLFLPGMVKLQKGRILNVASTAAFQPGPLMSVYFATKAYVLSFSCAIAQELKGTGVSITCLCPGPTATGFQAATFTQETRLTQVKKLPCPQKIAEYGYRAMLREKTVAVHGFLNKFVVFSIRFLPRWVTLRIVHFMQASI